MSQARIDQTAANHEVYPFVAAMGVMVEDYPQ
jgi:hypothetical protein